MWFFTAVATGLLAGLIHVFTGPDHLAAIAPLAADAPRRAWRTGFHWGLGHSAGTWFLAALALAFRESLPVDAVSAWSERLVGVVLVGVGLWALRRSLRQHVHTHVHTHDGSTHAHVHVHGHGHPPTPEASRRAPHHHHHGALGIGTLHGLAGTSHLVGILPALALPSRTAAVVYLACFGLGSIGAMTSFAVGVSLAARRGLTSGRFYRGAMQCTALAAIAIGGFWLSGL